MFKFFKRKRRKSWAELRQEDNQRVFDQQMNSIIKIADRNMQKALVDKKKVKDHVLISYDELLRVWFIAKCAKDDTLIQ